MVAVFLPPVAGEPNMRVRFMSGRHVDMGLKARELRERRMAA